MDKILIVRLGAMGDIVHALPAVTALRRQHPHAKIGWLVERRWQELLSATLVDQIHVADTKEWRKNPIVGANALAQLRRELRSQEYDACFDLQGATKSAVLGWLSQSKQFTGGDPPRESPAKLFYKGSVRVTKPHVIEQAAEICGVELPSRNDAAAALNSDPAAEQWCDSELQRRATSRFAILNPGAGWGAKQWPAERYGEVARGLRELGIFSLINAGPAEQALAEGVQRASNGAASVISCTVPQLIALTRRAELFIGGDTGPMHLANLMGVPVVALFGPTDPARNGPYYSPSVVLRNEQSFDSYSHTANQDRGLLNITAGEVVAAAFQLLGENG